MVEVVDLLIEVRDRVHEGLIGGLVIGALLAPVLAPMAGAVLGTVGLGGFGAVAAEFVRAWIDSGLITALS